MYVFIFKKRIAWCMCINKGEVAREAFGSGSRVALPAWCWGWTVSCVERLELLPRVQGCAGKAPQLGSPYREGLNGLTNSAQGV